MLQQRAKLRWLKHGDQSSKVFFRKINATRVKQRVFEITKVGGELLTVQHDVTQEFISYFQNLFGGPSLNRRTDLEFLRSELKHTVTAAEASLLVAPVKLFEAIGEFFRTGKLLKQINTTLIALIPKRVLPLLIDYSQNAFVPGRSITDNILLAQELLAASFSVSLNGSIHGFFKGGRGLRQGDPMSPYLFVWVMEIWNSLLRFRVKNAAEFQYHWKCKELGLINLCFADEVLLFCKAHMPSITILTDTLIEFAALLGLKVNPAKSQIIFSRAVQQERQQILEYLGFQEGSLPVKYLGIPLTSSRLTIVDCRPLIDKVDARLAGWNHQNLSYAGRLQLINSVLSTLQTYWGSAFILPKGHLARTRSALLNISSRTCSHGLPLSSALSSVIQRNQWCWPASTDSDIINIMSQLPPIHATAADSISWRSSSGKFTFQAAVSLIQPTTPRVFLAWTSSGVNQASMAVFGMAKGTYLGEQMERESPHQRGISSNIGSFSLPFVG
ncbi:hypothetical protein Sango_3019100 [Sesamum angolense]|uniref:Reverse transcriptase domain-containing protein n=1 Tax=Sesamum angolense TaxID=2727404 RepID=A0AAE1T3L2_9LAMI|nr:hypothetical protein Sango_3019100 [Sesamum angolense]